MARETETIGERLRLLLTDYAALIDTVEDLKKAMRDGDETKTDDAVSKLAKHEDNTYQDIIDITFLDELQKPWRLTKLGMMQDALGHMT